MYRDPLETMTIGVEEEYLLVNTKRTPMDLADDPPDTLLSECEARMPNQVTPELMRSQIESAQKSVIRCKMCVSNSGIYARSSGMYRTVMGSRRLRLRLTHLRVGPIKSLPLGRGMRRYRASFKGLADSLSLAGCMFTLVWKTLSFIDLMNQLKYFLPHILAFSTSSPFWDSQKTGLMCYRLSVFDRLPRTGLGEYFESFAQYERYVEVMVNAGLVSDTSKLWWDLRPNARFPTLEMRVSDVCTHIDDAVAVAALYVCLARRLIRLRTENQRWRAYALSLIKENRWRAQRYGLDDGLVDFGKGKVIPWSELLNEMLDLIYEDAVALECEDEVNHLRLILDRGTSAHWQLRAFETAIANGCFSRRSAEGSRQYVGPRNGSRTSSGDWLICESMGIRIRIPHMEARI